MPETEFDPDRIGPTIDLAAVELPPDVAAGFARLYDVDVPVRDAAAWIRVTREHVAAASERSPIVDDLCTAADGDHVFVPETGGDRQAYVCVLDPLAYPFLTGRPGTVRSSPPRGDDRIEVAVTAEGIDVSHPDAVVSIGVAAEPVERVTPSVLYRQVCDSVHAFPDREAYAAWAVDVDAATTAVPVGMGVGVAKGIAGALFD